MTAHHEARINDALKQLGEEFRLGMVQAAEYRARRKQLLESWGEIDATTSPGSLRSKTATTPNRAPLPGRPGGAGAAQAPRKTPVVAIVIVIVVLAILAVVGMTVLKPRPAPLPVATMPPPEPPSAQVLAVTKAADEFLAANSWESEAIDRFLGAWRQVPAAERPKALEQASMRTLRYKLDQNIQSESQLVAPDAPAEERQRLTLLEGFARELSGENQ